MQATTAFTALLNIHPHDPGVLRELAPLLASQELHATASSLYLAAFDFFRTSVPHVDPTSAASAEAISSFHYQDLEALADLLTVQKQYAKVVSVIKQGVRWLQGREHEAGWDALGDDREFDQARKERTGWEKVSRVWEDAPVHELDVRLRVRLAVARMAEGRVEEAQVSLIWLVAFARRLLNGFLWLAAFWHRLARGCGRVPGAVWCRRGRLL